MKLSERINDAYDWLEQVTGKTINRLDVEEVAQLEAELAGNALMDAEAESFISGQEVVPIGTLAEIERLKEYIIEEVGIEHVPSEWGGEA